MAAASKPRLTPAPVRCAIYTRKSTDEGLDSDFNTLDAQRESAEAFIASQRHEGWLALPQKYDDGGFTGANMERPALKRLLDDIRNGLVNCVVVYKVDRLTRSLLDFAKIMEVFDKHGASFVSVTQQFNTTASLGRLTLNVLLSFAQFEREMIAERTRDKMSAARRKGKWVGGNPVLGYDVHPDGGALLVNEGESVHVRAIFGLYLELGSLLPVVEELARRGWLLKQWTTRDGKIAGGKPFTRARLHQLLTNITYTGQVRHRGEVYPGEHEAIVDAELWEKVQARLKANAPGSGRSLRNKYGALLKGIVRCATCNVGMVHTYTQKDARLYRYYVCVKAHQRGWTQCETRSVSAPELEQAVIDQIRGVGRNPVMLTAVMRELEESGADDVRREDVAQALREFDGLWSHLAPREQEHLIKTLVETVSYDGRTGTVTVGFRSAGLKQLCLLQEAYR
jgi:site-specific DNA recombinase